MTDNISSVEGKSIRKSDIEWRKEITRELAVEHGACFSLSLSLYIYI
jgi:hypothetical protein